MGHQYVRLGDLDPPRIAHEPSSYRSGGHPRPDSVNVHTACRQQAPLWRCAGQRHVLELCCPGLASYLRLHLLDTKLMSRHSAVNALLTCAGLVAAPLAWLVSVQLGQILPYVDCANRSYLTAVCVAAGTSIARAAPVLSWRRGSSASPADGH